MAVLPDLTPADHRGERGDLKTQHQRPKVSVVSPVYVCGECLEDLVDRIGAAMPVDLDGLEVILVDDASPDSAWARILELNRTRGWVRGIRLSRNFGQHYAIAAGIESARGEVIVVMDCDLQDAPESIPLLLAALESGSEIALAERIDRQDSAPKRFFSWLFFRVLSWLTDQQQDHRTANFGAYSRKVIDTINAMPERERCFPMMARWTGFKIIKVPVEHARRKHGKSSYSIRHLLSMALSIALSYSDKPLRLVVGLGFWFACLALLIAAWGVFRYFAGDIQVAGFTSILAGIWLVGAATITCMGIVGLYIGRLFIDAKSRPYYLVAETTPEGQQNGSR